MRKSTTPPTSTVPEAVGIFDTCESLQKAIYDLMMTGFSRYDISLLADQNALGEKLGASSWTASGLAENPAAPRAAFVSEEAIGGSPSAVVGTLLARRVGKHQMDY